MPFDTAALAPASHTEAAALAYAARLDVLWPNADDALHDALMAVGELLGGLGVHGFSADLRAHLARVEDDLLSDAGPRDYSPGLGPNDPDAVFSTKLSDEIDRSREDDCASWLADARERMAAVLTMIAEARS